MSGLFLHLLMSRLFAQVSAQASLMTILLRVVKVLTGGVGRRGGAVQDTCLAPPCRDNRDCLRLSQ